ncbi:MAG: pyridoxamine 5'-phosphate oxidase family protein [Eubacterium sp.]|nr:pyridoxamine 5'-phosphate oxidase family protein [Eubacterium sp.]
MSEFKPMRRFKQEITAEECVEVLNKAPRGILSFHGENGYPYAIPLNQFFNEEDGKIYFHCAKDGLKIDLMKQNDKVCFTVMDEGFRKEGEWALNIRSVVCLGRLEPVTDREQIIGVCRKLGLKHYPTPESVEEELRKAGDRVNMLVMTIDRMTGKLVNES